MASISTNNYVQHAAYIATIFGKVPDRNKDDVQKAIQALTQVEISPKRGFFYHAIGGLVIIEGLYTMWANLQMSSQDRSENSSLLESAAVNNGLFCLKAAIMYSSAVVVDWWLGGETQRKTEELARSIFTIATCVKEPNAALQALQELFKNKNIQPLQSQEMRGFLQQN